MLFQINDVPGESLFSVDWGMEQRKTRPLGERGLVQGLGRNLRGHIFCQTLMGSIWFLRLGGGGCCGVGVIYIPQGWRA